MENVQSSIKVSIYMYSNIIAHVRTNLLMIILYIIRET